VPQILLAGARVVDLVEDLLARKLQPDDAQHERAQREQPREQPVAARHGGEPFARSEPGARLGNPLRQRAAETARLLRGAARDRELASAEIAISEPEEQRDVRERGGM